MLQIVKDKNVPNLVRGNPDRIQPLPGWQSGLLFGLPALAMIISIHWFMPFLQTKGLTIFESLVVAHTVPTALLLVPTFVMYERLDGYPLTWPVLRQRFRYPKLTLKMVGAGMGLFGLQMLGYGLFSQLGRLLLEQGRLPLPATLPALLDPRISLNSSVLDDMVGGHIMGNWQVVILYVCMLGFNIVGEELWWRGYILPRQEAAHGRFTWVWHGLLWTGFHLFKWWDLSGLLPVCLLTAYVSQRSRNNWPAFIAHLLFNGLALVIVVTAVLTTIP